MHIPIIIDIKQKDFPTADNSAEPNECSTSSKNIPLKTRSEYNQTKHNFQ